MKRSGHRSTEGVRAYQREDPSAQIKISNALSSSRSLVPNTEEALISSSGKTERAESIAISEQDRLLVNACIEYEKNQSSQINLGGILEGASVQNVNVNITYNKS